MATLVAVTTTSSSEMSFEIFRESAGPVVLPSADNAINVEAIIRTLFILFLFDNLNFKRNSRGGLFLLKIHFFPFVGITRTGSMGIISACLPVFGRHSGKHPLYSRAKERKKRVMTKCSDICLLLTY